MLGHVAVALRDTPKTEYIIFQFFAQHFTHIPNQPHLVSLIIDQLACMIIAKDEKKVNISILIIFLLTIYIKIIHY